VVELVVGILHLDDRSVDEHADRDGDAGQRHDVDRDTHVVHRDEREQHRDRNCRDGHERGGDVPQEQQDHSETMIISMVSSCFRVSMARWMRSETVVGGDHLDAGGQRRLDSWSLSLSAR